MYMCHCCPPIPKRFNFPTSLLIWGISGIVLERVFYWINNISLKSFSWEIPDPRCLLWSVGGRVQAYYYQPHLGGNKWEVFYGPTGELSETCGRVWLTTIQKACNIRRQYMDIQTIHTSCDRLESRGVSQPKTICDQVRQFRAVSD